MTNKYHNENIDNDVFAFRDLNKNNVEDVCI